MFLVFKALCIAVLAISTVSLTIRDMNSDTLANRQYCIGTVDPRKLMKRNSDDESNIIENTRILKKSKPSPTSETPSFPFPTYEDAQMFATEGGSAKNRNFNPELDQAEYLARKIKGVFAELLSCVGENGTNGDRFFKDRLKFEAEVRDMNMEFAKLTAFGNVYLSSVSQSANMVRNLLQLLLSRLGLELRFRAQNENKEVFLAMQVADLELSLYNGFGPDTSIVTDAPDFLKKVEYVQQRLNMFMREHESELLGESAFSKLLGKDVTGLKKTIRGLLALATSSAIDTEQVYETIDERLFDVGETKDSMESFINEVAKIIDLDKNRSSQESIDRWESTVSKKKANENTEAVSNSKEIAQKEETKKSDENTFKITLPPRRISPLSVEALLIQLNEMDRSVESLHQYFMNLRKYTKGFDYTIFSHALEVQNKRLNTLKARPSTPDSFKERLERISRKIRNMQSFVEETSVDSKEKSKDAKTDKSDSEPSAPTYEEIYETLPGHDLEPIDVQVHELDLALNKLRNKHTVTSQDIEQHQKLKKFYSQLLDDSDRANVPLTDARKAKLRHVTSLFDALTEKFSKM